MEPALERRAPDDPPTGEPRPAVKTVGARVGLRPLWLTIRLKVFLGFTVITVVYGVVQVLGFSRLQHLRKTVSTLVENVLPLTETMTEGLRQLRIYQEGLGQLEDRLLRSQIPKYDPFGVVEQMQKQFRGMRERTSGDATALELVARSLLRLDQLLTGRDMLDNLRSRERRAVDEVLTSTRADVKTNLELWEALARGYVRAVDRGQYEEARDLRDELKKIVLAIRQELGAARREFPRFVSRVDAVAKSSEQRTIWVVGTAMLGALGVSVVVLVWVSSTLKPIQALRRGANRVAQGDFALVTVPSRDELGQLAEDFNQMAMRLAERDRQLTRQRDELHRAERLATVGKLSSQISHEIRNPLSSMGLNTELLIDELELIEAGQGSPAEAKALTRSIGAEIDRLANVTSQYLRLARLPRPELQAADLNSLVQDLLSFMREEMSRHRVVHRFEPDAALPPFPFDEGQLRQCVLNFIRNAIDALTSHSATSGATRSGEEGRITVRTRLVGDRVVLTVHDNGPGIAPENLARLFEPFFTTKSSGTGLGLALVREIVAAHYGDVRVDSQIGVGTTFTATLPVAPTGLSPLPPEGET
jgi:two-component system, NtrC family, sensor kinase